MIGRIISALAAPIADLASEFIEDKDKRAEFQNRLSLALIAQESELVNAARDVVVAEAQSESWLARNWRPLIMLTFGAILANNYIIVPWLMAFGIETVAVLEIPEGMWGLLTVGLGGYVVGRTIEKTGSGVNINVGQNQNAPSDQSS
jgi:hypothetical protein